MPFEPVDIAVVGSGVSGSSVALAALKTDNVSVHVFEEHAKIGEPSHCSGHVGIQAFTHFIPKLPKSIIENEIKGAVVYAPSGQTLTLYRPKPVTWVLNRVRFDRHLAKLAQRAGATLHTNSRAQSIKRSEHGRFRLKLGSPKEREVDCRIVVDAAGCGGSISRYAGLPQPNPRMVVNSAQFNAENLRDVDEDLVEVYFGQGYAPGFFGWIIPRRDGTAKIGIAASPRNNVRRCFELFVKKHPVVSSKLKRARVATPVMYHPIPVGGGIDRTSAEGILRVGDAASQVKPTTGGGIVYGFACGQIAGETAADAIRDNDTSAAKLSIYEGRWRRLFGFDLSAMALLRRMLYQLPDRDLDRIFTLSRELKTDEILSTTEDIDFQGRTLLSLSRDPRLLITLLSASILSAPSLLALRRKRGGGRQ